MRKIRGAVILAVPMTVIGAYLGGAYLWASIALDLFIVACLLWGRPE